MSKPKISDNLNDYFDTLLNCKKYFYDYKNSNDYNDFKKAKEEYYKLNDILNSKLDKLNKNIEDTEIKKQFLYNEFNTMINCLSYEELYTITNHKNWLLTDCEN